MNDELDTAHEAPEHDAQAPDRQGAGASLRAARERLNMSLEDVAAQIKIAPRKLAALEAERWEELPERPYLRGLIRNYSRVLHLDSEPLLRAAETSLGSSPPVPDFHVTPTLRAPFPQRPAGPHESPVSKWMMIGVLACAVIIGALVLPGTAPMRELTAMFEQHLHQGDKSQSLVANNAPTAHPERSAAQDISSQSLQSASAAGANLLPPAAPSPVPASDKSAQPQALNQTTPQVTPQKPALLLGSAAANADASALHMQFKDDSWVEVRQADGKLVSSQIFHSGTEQAIDASAPLQVVIGNAPAVNVSFRGKTIDLDPYTHARVAHLSIP